MNSQDQEPIIPVTILITQCTTHYLSLVRGLSDENKVYEKSLAGEKGRGGGLRDYQLPVNSSEFLVQYLLTAPLTPNTQFLTTVV